MGFATAYDATCNTSSAQTYIGRSPTSNTSVTQGTTAGVWVIRNFARHIVEKALKDCEDETRRRRQPEYTKIRGAFPQLAQRWICQADRPRVSCSPQLKRPEAARKDARRLARQLWLKSLI